MQLSFLEFPPLCLVSELGQTDSGFRNLIWIICPGPMASASCQLFCPSLVPWPCWQTFFVSVRRQPMIAEVNPMPCHLTLTNISIYVSDCERCAVFVSIPAKNDIQLCWYWSRYEDIVPSKGQMLVDAWPIRYFCVYKHITLGKLTNVHHPNRHLLKCWLHIEN